jgi:MFS family permease
MADRSTQTPWWSRRPVAWQSRGFRQLTRAWFFTNLADAALFLMVAVWVKELTGSDGAAAMVFAMIGLPALLAPFIGHLTDRVSRRRLLVASNLAMAPVVLSLLLVGSESQLWLVYVVVFVYGCAGYVTAGAQSGLIRDLLPDEILASGNGVLSTIDRALRLVSPLLGTGLYMAAGVAPVIVLTGACFAVTAILLARLEVGETTPADVDRNRYLTEVVAGFRHLARTPVLGVTTLAMAVGFGIIGLVHVAVFPVMDQGLGVDPAMLGALVSVQGVGAVAGGATASRVIARWGERRTVAIGMLLMALGLTPMVGTSLAAVIGGLVLIGYGAPLVLVAYTTLRQRLTPPRLQGRAATASYVAIDLPQTLTTLGAAAIIASVDYRLLIAVSIAWVALAALAIRPLRPDPVGLEPEPSVAA